MTKIWFITGASRGFGKIWAEAALERGDKVAATARSLEDVAPLREKYGANVLPLALDVNSPDGARDAVAEAHRHFGRLDVVVNNAGYGHFGAIEELTDDDIRAQLDTNVLGTLRVLRAALPILRAQKSGHVIGVSSILGLVTLPFLGAYNASKWAIEGLHESLAQEVAGTGIKVTILEPGVFGTDFAGSSMKQSAPNADYDKGREAFFAMLKTMPVGDPKATGQALLQVVDAANPPLRTFFGVGLLGMIRGAYEQRFGEWQQWDAVATAAHGNLAK